MTTMTLADQLDAARAKYAAALANPNPGNLSTAKLALERLLWRHRERIAEAVRQGDRT